ncbi:sucrose transport protein SUT5-like isoform X2 [Phragmites australis]|uniref:sucrose transport protein SUT5-like isoform X2 n=1 Tax=Phragmites australis TaxID=29695 RepID=UPI002D781933|nr:sucrose transport protein SUT5-like isoform X2 [Phragmites australis]
MEDGRGDSKEAARRIEWTTMNLENGGERGVGNGNGRKPMNIFRLFLACMVSGGIQYGWALQLSLLSPYSQTLGISHSYVSLTWICGPIAGFVVQPIVGYYSDRCTSTIGRRRPFILAGCLIICISVMLIGFSADIGRHLGDTKEHCSTFTGSRWAAAAVYIVGFWFLDFANNTVQGPARAMMADLSAGQHGPNVGQAIFSLWMALGSVLGYLSGANAKWHEWFPWLKTAACCDACANLKGAFLTAVVLIIISMAVTMSLAAEERLNKDDVDASSGGGCCSAFADLFKSLKNLPPSMFKVLAVTAVTWLSWFPFFQYNTDWMGREIYHGLPQGTGGKADTFNAGVREGAVGLLFCSIALGVTSFLIPKLCRKLTSRVVWAISNLLVFVFLTVMVVVGMVSMKGYKASLTAGLTGPDPTLKGIALAVFALIGIPQAVLFSVPWAVASEVAAEEGGGQGLTIGVLNIAIVVPQLVIALTAGPIDGAFNKGNTPAFGIGAAFAVICAVLALVLLPKTRGMSSAAVMAGGH